MLDKATYFAVISVLERCSVTFGHE